MPAIQDPRFYPRSPLQGVTKKQNTREAKRPRAPTAGRMKNRPGAAEPSGGALLSRAGCRGTYPPPAAGCMVTAFALDQKSTGALPMLLTISFYHIFWALRCNFQISPKFFATSRIKSPCHCFAVRSDTPSFNAAPNTV